MRNHVMSYNEYLNSIYRRNEENTNKSNVEIESRRNFRGNNDRGYCGNNGNNTGDIDNGNSGSDENDAILLAANNRRQGHVHEIIGSVKLAERRTNSHNHCFAGVTEEKIEVYGGHIHKFYTKTDFFNDHYHEIQVRTGISIPIGNGNDEYHIHYIDEGTEISEGHYHDFLAATMINNPTGME